MGTVVVNELMLVSVLDTVVYWNFIYEVKLIKFYSIK